MADITVTAARVALVHPESSETFNVILAEAATQGQALYQNTSGTYGLADANAGGKQQVRGVALEAGGAGQCVSMLKKGVLAGFTTATYDDPVYLSDTAGALSTTPGTLTVYCGRVIGEADAGLTETLYIECDWLRAWS